MFNLKNQEANTPYGSLSADDILANIRKRLGISEEASHDQGMQPQQNAQNNQQSKSVNQQVVNIHQAQSKNQPNLRQESSSNDSSFDDDFSLNMDFSSPEEAESRNGSNVNKAYRAYQNAMKSSYQQEINNGDEEELDEDFNSELGEWNPEEDTQENTYESEDFNAEQEELDEDFNAELGEWNLEEDDYTQFDSTEENQQKSNIHFLNNPSSNSAPSYGFGQIALNIETMFAKIVQDQVQDWCNRNLENVCRNIIKEELYKEKVESNKQ